MTARTLLLLALLGAFTLVPHAAGAVTCAEAQQDGIVLNLRIPGLPTCERLDSDNVTREYTVASGFPEYLITFYTWFAGAAGTLAVFMVMYGGFQWLTAAGNAGRIGEAKETVTGAIIGLILLLGSYVLLNTISPQFVTVSLEIEPVKQVDLGSNTCYVDTPGKCTAGQCSPLADSACISSSSGSCGCIVSCTADEVQVDYTRCANIALEAVRNNKDPNATNPNLQISSATDREIVAPPYYLSALLAAYKADTRTDATAMADLRSWLDGKARTAPSSCLLSSRAYPRGCLSAQSVRDTFVLSRAFSLAQGGQTDFLVLKREDTLVAMDLHVCCQLRANQGKCILRSPYGAYRTVDPLNCN